MKTQWKILLGIVTFLFLLPFGCWVEHKRSEAGLEQLRRQIGENLPGDSLDQLFRKSASSLPARIQFTNICNALSNTSKRELMEMLPNGRAQPASKDPNLLTTTPPEIGPLIDAIEQDGHLLPPWEGDLHVRFDHYDHIEVAADALALHILHALNEEPTDALPGILAFIRLAQWPIEFLEETSVKCHARMAIVWEALHAHEWSTTDLRSMNERLNRLPPRMVSRALFQSHASLIGDYYQLQFEEEHTLLNHFKEGYLPLSTARKQISGFGDAWKWARKRGSYLNYHWYGGHADQSWVLKLAVAETRLWQRCLDRQLITPADIQAVVKSQRPAVNYPIAHALHEIVTDTDTLRPAMSSLLASEICHRLTTTALALELFQREHQKYPGSLDQLVPQYLKEVPNDLNGKALQYRPSKNTRFDLYSLGINGVDDGGNGSIGTNDVDPTWLYGIDWVWPKPDTN